MKEVTHIEIRRVQNGYVVMAVNYNMMERAHLDSQPQRCSFVAQDIEALKSLIESIANMADLKWLPTVDLPMLEMTRRPSVIAEAGVGNIANAAYTVPKKGGAYP